MSETNTQLATSQDAPPLNTGLSIFDQGQFQQLYRVSEALSASSLIPQTLKGTTPAETTANCLLVVEQSSRWGLSPFAVMQCASVVHGKLMWEGKLVASVIEAQLGIRLRYDYTGTGESKSVTVSGKFPDEDDPRIITGTVAQWKTSGKGSPWDDPRNHERQLAYRGAREWCRRHAPSVMLGVITDDEEIHRGSSIRNVTPKDLSSSAPMDIFNEEEPAPEKEAPKPAKKAKAETNVPSGWQPVKVKAVEVEKGTTNRKAWERTRVTLDLYDSGETITAGTFSTTIGLEAEGLKGSNAFAIIETTPKGVKLNAIASEIPTQSAQ